MLTRTTIHADGTWRGALNGETRDILDPADGLSFAVVAEGGAADADDAVAAARAAFDSGVWPGADEWAGLGADGWDAASMDPYFGGPLGNIVPVDEKDRNAIARDFVDAAQDALDVPRAEGFNRKPFHEGVGFFDLVYHPEDNKRSSASVAYLHPFLDRPDLHLLLETRAYRLEFDGARATGVRARTKDGEDLVLRASREVVVCAGAVDTRGCGSTPASDRARSWPGSASTSATTCRVSARTCSTTRSR